MVKVMKMLMKQAKVRTSRKLGKRICGRRLNNGGMSLVEVVVAMTIFAVVTVPVLHALTTSAYYNQKARKRQNVTALAESVMENFKGYSLDSLENEVFTGVAGAKKLGLEISNDSDISYTYADSTKRDSAITFQIQNVKSEKAYPYPVKRPYKGRHFHPAYCLPLSCHLSPRLWTKNCP